MAQKYSTRAGDTVDWIAYQHYTSSEVKFVEMILEANPGLADYGPTLPAGVVVVLPVAAKVDRTAVKSVISLWT